MILISRRKPFFVVFAINAAVKGLNFGRRPVFFWTSPPIALKKGLNFWRRPFFLVFAIDSSGKRPEFLAKTFLFWFAGMVVARWNLVWTKCDPLVQKVADPWCTLQNRRGKCHTFLRIWCDLQKKVFKAKCHSFLRILMWSSKKKKG